MTTTEIVLPGGPSTAAAARAGQATMVEQSRAIAEVQAAVVVAQQVPRDVERALGEMRDSCGRLALANRAFYEVRNRGNGPSVHLARELGRVWGNVQYGVHELRRDDDAGESEIQAFAWDLQTNVRSTRTFVVPHARMAGGQRKALVDLQDIYLSNQNIGARAVRECIFTVLPTWFTEEAQDLCRATLDRGDGKPLEVRVAEMVAAFEGIGVALVQLEQKLGGRKRGQWTAADVAQMGITYTSITRDGLDIAEAFPAAQVTAAEITGRTTAPQTAAPADPDDGDASPLAVDRIGRTRLTRLQILFQEAGVKDRARRLDLIARLIGRRIDSTTELTIAEGEQVITQLEKDPPPADEASEHEQDAFPEPTVPVEDAPAEPEGWK